MVYDQGVNPLQRKQECLNPCYSGIWFMILINFQKIKILKLKRLNPCYSGIWFMIGLSTKNIKKEVLFVLILVIVEYGL